MKYRLIIFDSDGTLADTLPWMREVFNELADAHGFRRVEPRDYAQYRDLHGRELLRALGLPLWKLPRVIADMRHRMARRVEPFELFPGIAQALQELHSAGLRLGVVSSNARENVERILGPGNAALIHHWGCGASVFGKAARIKSTARNARSLPEETLYVGDEIRDAIACSRAGVDFAAVAWGQHSAAALLEHKPVVLFESPQEMTRWILRTGITQHPRP